MKKKILFLPDAGPKNPFQYQWISYLQRVGYEVAKMPKFIVFPIVRAVWKHKPDVVYFDWIQSFVLGKQLSVTLLKCTQFVAQILYLQFKKIPIVHTVHNIQNHAGVWTGIEQNINRFFLPKCHRIRVYSEVTKEKLVARYALAPEKISVIQDIPFHLYYPNHASPEAARHFLKIPEQAFVYAFFGSLKPYKGIENLINSFRQVARPMDYLVIAGAAETPDYERKIRQAMNKHPRILLHQQFVPREQVQYYMNAANVMVLPFHQVEHSGSLDLCMSFKKAVITLKTEHHAKLLAHQSTLLFHHYSELPTILQNAHHLNLECMGNQNFQLAQQSNHHHFPSLFQ